MLYQQVEKVDAVIPLQVVENEEMLVGQAALWLVISMVWTFTNPYPRTFSLIRSASGPVRLR